MKEEIVKIKILERHGISVPLANEVIVRRKLM